MKFGVAEKCMQLVGMIPQATRWIPPLAPPAPLLYPPATPLYPLAQPLHPLTPPLQAAAPRHWFMANAQCVVGDPSAPYAHTALSALGLAMEEEGLVAVVRVAQRKGATPRPYCLSPGAPRTPRTPRPTLAST